MGLSGHVIGTKLTFSIAVRVFPPTLARHLAASHVEELCCSVDSERKEVYCSLYFTLFHVTYITFVQQTTSFFN